MPKIKEECKQKFLASLIEVYEEYGLSLSHEDGQGGFIVEELSAHNVEWLREAYIRSEEGD